MAEEFLAAAAAVEGVTEENLFESAKNILPGMEEVGVGEDDQAGFSIAG